MWGNKNIICYLLFAIVLFATINDNDVQAKRIYSSSGGRRSSSSSSSSVRRNSYNKPSSSHSYSGQSPSSHSNPSLSHTGLSSLSYAGYNQQANRRQSASNTLSAARPGTNTHSPAPIGWNVPPKQGPPPAYSATNPVGGANTNINEKPPAYNPNFSAPPKYQSPSNTANRPVSATNQNSQPASYNRNRFNSTGGSFGSGNYHTPITATNAHNVQSSYYPAANLPAGVGTGQFSPGSNHYPFPSAGSGFPASGAFHNPGGHPPGITYHSPGALPPGAVYHNPAVLPPGATYYPSPPGHGPPAYYPSPAALPAGATFLPAGSAIPVGATFLQQPQKSSSGFGFGSGLLAGGLAGGLLGHALTPTHTKVVEHVPSYGGGGGGGVSRDDNNDKIIIINNGPPGSVATTDVGGGTTVINTATGQAQNPAPAAPAIVPPSYSPPAPAAEQPSQLYPINSRPMEVTNNDNGATAAGMAAGATFAAAEIPLTAQQAPPALASAEQPPAANPAAAGGIICVPVKVPETDPNDSTKTIEVEKIVCYPAPPPDSSTAIAEATKMKDTSVTPPITAASPTVTTADTAPKLTTLEGGVALAPIQTTTPLVVREGFVALAPINQNDQPSIMKIPGYVGNT